MCSRYRQGPQTGRASAGRGRGARGARADCRPPDARDGRGADRAGVHAYFEVDAANKHKVIIIIVWLQNTISLGNRMSKKPNRDQTSKDGTKCIPILVRFIGSYRKIKSLTVLFIYLYFYSPYFFLHNIISHNYTI